MVYLSLFPLLLLAVFFDLKSRKIPNKLILAGLVIGCVVSVVWGDGLLFFAKGCLLGLALFLPLYLLGGMAAGDVKFLMVIGGFVGAEKVLDVALYSFILGALMGLLMIVHNKKSLQLWVNLQILLSSLRLTVKKNNANQPAEPAISLNMTAQAMPFAPPMVLAVLYVFYKPFIEQLL